MGVCSLRKPDLRIASAHDAIVWMAWGNCLSELAKCALLVEPNRKKTYIHAAASATGAGAQMSAIRWATRVVGGESGLIECAPSWRKPDDLPPADGSGLWAHRSRGNSSRVAMCGRGRAANQVP